MIRCYVVACALLVASAPAWALDHNLIGLARSVITKNVPPDAVLTDAATASRRRYPDLREGDRWICAVGQPDDISAHCREHARALGWGFWRFPAHAKCPAGIYACFVRDGRLKPSGDVIACNLLSAVCESRED